MHSEISIWIDAPPDSIFPLAADLEQWARWLPHYHYVRILGRSGAGVHAAMSARRGVIPVFWEAVQTADPGSRTIRFRHVRGVTRGMEVLWTLTPEGGGTRARIDHDLDLAWPLIGSWVAERVIAREFIQPIAAKTLQRFKALAEGAEAEERRAPRRDASAPEAGAS